MVSFIVPYPYLIALNADFSRTQGNEYHLLNVCSSNNPFKFRFISERVPCLFVRYKSSYVSRSTIYPVPRVNEEFPVSPSMTIPKENSVDIGTSSTVSSILFLSLVSIAFQVPAVALVTQPPPLISS